MQIIDYDGNPITRPGAYAHVPMEVYHGANLCDGPSASRSQLFKMLEKSAAHLWDTHPLNPNRDEDAEESEALLIGKAAHHLLLGEADFEEHFVVHPETYPEGAAFPEDGGKPKPWNLNSNWCKAWVEDAQEDGLSVLKPRHVEAVEGMAGGLYANLMVRQGILNGHIETTLVAKDPKTGIWLKVRPDAIPTDSGMIADLKTIADVSDIGIERALKDSGLFMQGALTRRVMNLLGMEFDGFHLVFIEKKRPYICRVKTMIDADLDLGDDAIDATLRLYARCMERGLWLGPGGDQTDADFAQMSPFARRDIEYRIQQIEKELSI